MSNLTTIRKLQISELQQTDTTDTLAIDEISQICGGFTFDISSFVVDLIQEAEIVNSDGSAISQSVGNIGAQ